LPKKQPFFPHPSRTPEYGLIFCWKPSDLRPFFWNLLFQKVYVDFSVWFRNFLRQKKAAEPFQRVGGSA
jgi:hypothetical protein